MAYDSPHITLVDGSSLLYRAYHALPPLSNASGEPTGVIFGVSSMLRRMQENPGTGRIVVVFDAPGKTFRNDLYAEYKAHRPPMPDDLRVQCQPLHELVRAMGLPVLQMGGVEADDVIGTLATRAVAEGYRVSIATSDKDMAQLVGPCVTLENSLASTRLDEEGVLLKFGVRPDQMVDYLTLVGDASDNIPGVPGVGPKTAAKWLRDWGSLDHILAHADEISGKVGVNLRAFAAQIPLTRKLATIVCNLELPWTADELVPRSPDLATLRDLLQRYGFIQWLRQVESGAYGQLPLPPATPPPTVELHYECILDESSLMRLLAQLESAEIISFDTETTGLDYLDARIVGLSFATQIGKAAYIPLAHEGLDLPHQLNREDVLARLKPLLENPAVPKLGQHLKYDRHVLANHGIELDGIHHDTLLESYVLNSTATRHDMDSLARHYLNFVTTTFEDVAGKGARQIPFAQVPLDRATDYAAEDADVALRLHQHLWPRLATQARPCAVYQTLELPLIPVLGRMERCGVLVDAGRLSRQSQEMARRMAEMEQAAHIAAGHAFNLGSPKQIQVILYEELGIPVRKRTPNGQPSTAEEVLQELATEHELPRILLEHRALAKLRSTYTDRLPEMIHPASGRVHTSYHQAVTATGRLSSSDPNLQNIPVRSEEGRRIRQAFIAPQGWQIVAADYSQIELRIMAHLSEDPGLLAAFAHGEDIHRATAAEVFGVPVGVVTADQRRSAKAINFGLIYGMSAFGLARQLGVGNREAQDYVARYFARYPGVKAYMDRTRHTAREGGYVETLLGRRLYVPDIHARDAARRQYAERSAINAPMQGTAADIIKRAMIDVDRWLRDSRAPVRMIMQVHDELVFEVQESVLAEALQRIPTIMGQAACLAVPLVVDARAGQNWDEAH